MGACCLVQLSAALQCSELYLTQVAGASVEGKTYKEVLNVLRAASRPPTACPPSVWLAGRLLATAVLDVMGCVYRCIPAGSPHSWVVRRVGQGVCMGWRGWGI